MKKQKLKLSQTESLNLFKNVLSLVQTSDSNFFRLKKLRGAMGYCEWENGIVIDYRRELVPTIIHECIHFLNPEWSESEVLYAEKRVINCINAKQVVGLLSAFVLHF